jgi:hypothetical protein
MIEHPKAFDHLPELSVGSLNDIEKRTAFAIAGQPDNGFVVTWTSVLNDLSVGRFGQKYDQFGNKISGVFSIEPDISRAKDLGAFVVFAGRKRASRT